MATDVPGNREAIEAWNTVLFDKFVAFRDVLSTALALHGDRAIARLAPAQGARVVDIGCGFGDTTVQLAERVGPTGLVIGIDAAANFIERARSEAGGRANIRYEIADVESEVPGGPYDHAFSRMGTMFFDSPVFALRNIRKVLRPGGTLTMAVWRKKEANECFYNAEIAVREIVGDPPKSDAVTCGPGPFSMASCDVVSDQLLAAGYTDIHFERSDGDMLIGRTLDEAVQFSLMLGPAGEVFRLAGPAGEARRSDVEAALRTLNERSVRADGHVVAPSSVWLVTASAP